jgi:hypothetical protein
LAWLLATGVDLDRLARQVEPLDQVGRELAGHYLISVAAAADPALGPATITALGRVYRILGLDRDLLFSRLHEHNTAGPRPRWRAMPAMPATPVISARPPRSDDLDGQDEPVVVRPADPSTGGYALPWAAPVEPCLADGEIQLDPAAISRKLAETEAVTDLLNAIFDIDEPASAASEPPQPQPQPQQPQQSPPQQSQPLGGQPPGDDGARPIAGLDLAHSRLLRVLAARPSWTREEFAVLAGAHGMLPDGALDLLNEAAIEAAGAAVVEGDATLAVDDDVLQEMIR